jgi:O-acetyl-ADP-ribose deacetylase (regulator of RNase III)
MRSPSGEPYELGVRQEHPEGRPHNYRDLVLISFVLRGNRGSKVLELVGQIGATRFVLVQGDITNQDTDAIVNAANSGLMGGGGVDGAIHRAGGPAIIEECRAYVRENGRCAPGKAVITGGGNLKAKWVVHAVGPVWRGGTSDEEKTLASAYLTSLELASASGARSISFPSISTGAYGYPVELAAAAALRELKQFAEKNPASFDELRFVLFDTKTYESYKAAAGSIL